MAFLVVEKGDNRDIGRRFSLGEAPVLIGRATAEHNPDIPLHDEYVSRRHAEIIFDQDHFNLRDLNSTNGTAIDEQRIEPRKTYPLKGDSVIGLGLAPGGACVMLRFKESPTVSTAHIGGTRVDESPISWLKIHKEKGKIWVDEKQIIVSRKEYDLILCLYRKAGKVCQRDELIAQVWPEAIDAAGVSDAAIDQLVHRLRLKIEPDPSHPRRLLSRKGFGYMIVG